MVENGARQIVPVIAQVDGSIKFKFERLVGKIMYDSARISKFFKMTE